MKALFSDYDQTLLIDGKMPKPTLYAIDRWQKAGHLFGIVTGRHLDSIRHEMDLYGIDPSYIIANNGTLVVDRDNKVLAKSTFTKDDANQLLAYLLDHWKDDLYTANVNNGYTFGRYVINPGSDFVLDHTIPYDQVIDDELTTFFIEVKDPTKTPTIIADLEKAFSHLTFAFNEWFIDVTLGAINKQTALEDMRQYLGIAYNDFYCVGDGENDMAMLEHFHSFVMEHAVDHVLARGKQVVQSFDQVVDILLK